MLGVGYCFDCFGDVWYLVIEFNYYEIICVSLSYDFNIFEFQIVINCRGGLELNVCYFIKKVCFILNFKFCLFI